MPSRAALDEDTEHLVRSSATLRRQMSDMAAAFNKGAMPDEMHMIDPIINVLGFFDRPVSVSALADTFEKHLWPNYKFRSTMEDGYWVEEHTHMNRSYHFQVKEVSSELEIDSWVQGVMCEALNPEYPPWQVTILRAPSGCRSAAFLRIHHSIGDGLSLIFAFSPFVSCEGGDMLAKIPLPNALLPASRRRQESQKASSTACCGKPALLNYLRGGLSVLGAKHDTELCFNTRLQDRIPHMVYNHSRVYTRFPPISLETVKQIRKLHHCTVNDVLMAALTGALREYAITVGEDAALQNDEEVEFKTIMMMALPREVDEDDLVGSTTNSMLYVSCNLPIDDASPAGRLQRVASTFADFKDGSYIAGLAGFTNFVKGVAPTSFLRKTAGEVFSKHSLLVTNVPSCTVPVTVPKQGGEVMREIQMVFPNIIPQVSIISYDGRVNANIVADPSLFAQPRELGRLWQEEFQRLLDGC